MYIYIYVFLHALSLLLPSSSYSSLPSSYPCSSPLSSSFVARLEAPELPTQNGSPLPAIPSRAKKQTQTQSTPETRQKNRWVWTTASQRKESRSPQQKTTPPKRTAVTQMQLPNFGGEGMKLTKTWRWQETLVTPNLFRPCEQECEY